FYGAPQLKNGTNIQRAKALLSGNFKALQYDFSYEFIENELENAHIGLSTAWGSVAVGQVSPSFGLQNTGDDQALPMLDST
ncbi:hypothetical protein GN156_37085, partial [bacterium LRH843]|nr:hypothetical protein [bacterium LRH843]